MGTCKSNTNTLQLEQRDYTLYFVNIIKNKDDKNSSYDLQSFLSYFSQNINSTYIQNSITYLLKYRYIYKLYIILDSNIYYKISPNTYYRIILYSIFENWDIILNLIIKPKYLDIISKRNCKILYRYAVSSNTFSMQKKLIEISDIDFQNLFMNETNSIHDYVIGYFNSRKSINEINEIAKCASLWFGVLKEFTNYKYSTNQIRSALVSFDSKNVKYIFNNHSTLLILLRNQLNINNNFDIINLGLIKK